MARRFDALRHHQLANCNGNKQIRGLAMGNRLSGTLAIIVMDRFERRFVYNELQPSPVVFVRYVDDVGTVVPNTQVAQGTLEHLNKKHPTIQFELETPGEDGFLPILDIKVKIKADGSIERKLFTKEANKGITLHFNSHHSSSVKTTTVLNELARAERCSTPEHREEAISSTLAKMEDNGYSSSWLSKAVDRGKRPRKNKEPRATSFSFRFPFVTDAFNNGIQQLFEKYEIPARLVNPRGQTLLNLAQERMPSQRPCRSSICPQPSICQRSSVVYEATCQLCGRSYIGMTSRRLHDRMREHMASARKKDEKTAFGVHYEAEHPKQKPKISFSVLFHQRDELRLHVEEAMAIKSRKPELNRRQEELGTGFLP